MEEMCLISIYADNLIYWFALSYCMTAKQTPEKPSRYWHEAFESIKGRNDVKVHLLLHLLHGEDYAYNIAKFYRKSSIEINPLCDQSQIQPILSDMEKKEFLRSRNPPSVRRNKKFFSLNPAILQSPTGACPYHLPEGVLSIRNEDVEKLFTGLEKKGRPNSDQSGIETFDFVTFLLAARDLAKVESDDLKTDLEKMPAKFEPGDQARIEAADLATDLANLAQSIDTYIAEVWRLEREKRRINSLKYNVVAYVAPRKE